MSAAAFIIPVFAVLNMALDLYWWVIIVMAVMSWLLAFDVINMRNDFVRSIWNAVTALTEPRCGRSAGSCRPSAAWIFRRSSCCCCSPSSRWS